jgi:hypothetical protein
MDFDERLGQIDWSSIWEIEDKALDELLCGYYPDLTEKEKVICKIIFCFYFEYPATLYDLIVPTTVEWHKDLLANEKVVEDEIKHLIEKGVIKLKTALRPHDGCGSNDCERRIVLTDKKLDMSNMDIQNESWLIQCKKNELMAAYFPPIKKDNTTYEYSNQEEYYIKQDLEEYYNQREYSRYHCRKQILVFEVERNCCLLPWGRIHHKDNNNQNKVWYNLEGKMNYYHKCYSMYDWARRGKSQEDYKKRVLGLLEKHKTDANIKGDVNRGGMTGYYAVRDMGLDINQILRALYEKDFFPSYMTEEGKAWWLVAVLESEIEQIWLWSWQAVLCCGFGIDIGQIRYFIPPRR